MNIKSSKGKKTTNYIYSRLFRITPDFSVETLKARRNCMNALKTIRDHSTDYYTQQNYQLQYIKKKEKHTMVKQNLSNIYYESSLTKNTSLKS